MEREKFEENVLKEIAEMNKTMSLMSESMTAFEGRMETALTEVKGKIKGNQELITQELNQYTHRDKCELHRTNQGERFESLQERVTTLETLVNLHMNQATTNNQTFRDMLTSWAPGIIKTLLWVGGITYALSKGIF